MLCSLCFSFYLLDRRLSFLLMLEVVKADGALALVGTLSVHMKAEAVELEAPRFFTGAGHVARTLAFRLGGGVLIMARENTLYLIAGRVLLES